MDMLKPHHRTHASQQIMRLCAHMQLDPLHPARRRHRESQTEMGNKHHNSKGASSTRTTHTHTHTHTHTPRIINDDVQTAQTEPHCNRTPTSTNNGPAQRRADKTNPCKIKSYCVSTACLCKTQRLVTTDNFTARFGVTFPTGFAFARKRMQQMSTPNRKKNCPRTINATCAATVNVSSWAATINVWPWAAKLDAPWAPDPQCILGNNPERKLRHNPQHIPAAIRNASWAATLTATLGHNPQCILGHSRQCILGRTLNAPWAATLNTPRAATLNAS